MTDHDESPASNAAAPVPPPRDATYAAPERPRFVDHVLGMRGVVAVALACLVLGGVSGFVLGHATGSDGGRFGRGPAFFDQRGAFPQGQGGLPVPPGGGSGQQPGGGQPGR
jgi:hypothetical protein